MPLPGGIRLYGACGADGRGCQRSRCRRGNRSGDIALVLLDLGLPDGDGMIALEAVRGEYDAPVVIVTNHEDPALRRRTRQNGAAGYFVKAGTPLLYLLVAVRRFAC